MTLLGVIPSNRALDRTDMTSMFNVPWAPPEYLPGPWPTNRGFTSGPQAGSHMVWCGFMTQYAAAVGYWWSTENQIYEYVSGWAVSGVLGSYLYYNLAYSHELMSMTTQSWVVAAGATQWQLNLAVNGLSDGNDYATGFLLMNDDYASA